MSHRNKFKIRTGMFDGLLEDRRCNKNSLIKLVITLFYVFTHMKFSTYSKPIQTWQEMQQHHWNKLTNLHLLAQSKQRIQHNNIWTLFKVNEALERRKWRRSGFFIVNFEQISHVVMVLK